MNVLFSIVIFVTLIAAYITHIVVCLAAHAWALMIVGALIVPVAFVHGFATWLGYSWV